MKQVLVPLDEYQADVQSSYDKGVKDASQAYRNFIQKLITDKDPDMKDFNNLEDRRLLTALVKAFYE